MTDLTHLPGLRWTILRTCRMGGHLGATETMIMGVVRAEYIASTQQCMRDELEYLEQRKLIIVERSEITPWRVRLTRAGYDVADYMVPCEAGIDRPPHAQVMPHHTGR